MYNTSRSIKIPLDISSHSETFGHNVDVAGGAVHVDTVEDGAIELDGAVPSTVSALTKTGITWPVPKLKVLCPITSPYQFPLPTSQPLEKKKKKKTYLSRSTQSPPSDCLY